MTTQGGAPAGSPTGTQPATEAGPSGPRAGFWIRVGAYIVDAAILGIAQFALQRTLGAVGYTLSLVVTLGYFAYFEGGPSGQTVGKRAFGIRVVDLVSGGPIGPGRALIRFLGKLLSALAFGIGFLWMLWDRERQCWDDKLAHTAVVPASAYPVANWP